MIADQAPFNYDPNHDMPKTTADLKIDQLPYSQVENLLAHKPALLLPLGGLEPLGPHVAIGANNRCCESLCSAISEKSGFAQAPLLNYGCTTPFRAFGGCGGVKPRTLASVIYSILHDYVSQGWRYICLIDGSYDNYEPLLGAAKRIAQRGRARVVIFSWQREPGVRSFIAKNSELREPGRSEFGLLSLASFCAPDLFSNPSEPKHDGAKRFEAYRTWRKRGRDPEKYRKIFPNSLTGNGEYDTEFGKELFEHIIKEGTKLIMQTAAEQDIHRT